MKKSLPFITTFLLLSFFALYFSPSSRAEDATASVRDLVREKVKETIDTLTNKPTSVIGTLDSPSGNNFEVKTRENKTAFVSTDDQTKYFQYTKGKKKEVKFEDLPLGEFVIALGYKNNQNVLTAKRVIGYDQSPIAFDKVSFFGDVQSIEKTTFTVNNPHSKDSKTVKIMAKTRYSAKESDFKLANLQEGDRLVVVGTTNEKGQMEAIQIHLVSAKSPQVKQDTSPKPKPTTKPSPTLTP